MKFHVFNKNTGKTLGVVDANNPERALDQAVQAALSSPLSNQRVAASSGRIVAVPAQKYVVERGSRFEIVYASTEEYAADIAGEHNAVVWTRCDELYRRWFRRQVGDELFEQDQAPEAVVELFQQD